MRAGQKRITVSIRVSEVEERLVRRIARRRKVTVSDVIRDAVGRLADEETRPARPFDEIADLVGSVRGLPSDLSERTGERFAATVRAKARDRK